MGLVKFSSDFLMESFTLVDNLFINEHLPYCDEKQIKVYLYGLYLCSTAQGNNSLESMCETLGISAEEVLETYGYFEDAGLCRIISKRPLEVKYLSLKGANQPPKKYKAEKWHDFNVDLQSLFPERQITPNEFNEYYCFLDASKLEHDAMLMIAQYCINLKGQSVGYRYILTVARNWTADNVKTAADVEERLKEYDAQTEEMRELLSVLNRKGSPELEEKQMLLKWKRSWGFEPPAIIAAAKTLKGSKTFKKLEERLDEFYRMSVFTQEEMQDYAKRRDQLFDLTVSINKTVGVYYQSLEHVVEVYTAPWLSKGFSEDALKKIAHYCFISGVRTLDGMNGVVLKFYAQGCLTESGINEYIGSQIEQDSKIKEIIAASGRSRAITASDRDFYKTWVAVWGFSHDVIKYAAELSVQKTYPNSHINQFLSFWKQKSVRTVEDAKKHALPAISGSAASSSKNFTERNYTDEEIQDVITSIDKLKDIDL